MRNFTVAPHETIHTKVSISYRKLPKLKDKPTSIINLFSLKRNLN